MTVVVVDNTSASTSTAYLDKLLDCLKMNGVVYKVICTMVQFESMRQDATAYILSGSSTHIPNMSDDQKRLNAAVIRSGRPVLGICFGAQYLAKHFGGEITKMSRFICESRVIRPTGFCARFCAQFRISRIPKTFEPIFTAHLDGEPNSVVAFRHRSRPLFGTLFHPEYFQHTHHFILDFVRHHQIIN